MKTIIFTFFLSLQIFAANDIACSNTALKAVDKHIEERDSNLLVMRKYRGTISALKENYYIIGNTFGESADGQYNALHNLYPKNSTIYLVETSWHGDVETFVFFFDSKTCEYFNFEILAEE